MPEKPVQLAIAHLKKVSKYIHSVWDLEHSKNVNVTLFFNLLQRCQIKAYLPYTLHYTFN